MSRRNEFGQPIGEPVENWQAPPFPERKVLVGQTCALEPLHPERHAPDMFEANRLGDGRMWTYLPYGPFKTLDEYRAWLETTCQGNDPLFYVIVPRGPKTQEPGKAAGLASYLRITPESGSLEIGHLAFSPQLQTTTAATEALYLMMKHTFDLGYRRCEWKCDALNEKSRRAAQRLGFSFEGIFRQATLYKGRNRDTAWYAVTDRAWAKLRRAFETWLQPENFDADGKQRLSLSSLTADALEPSR